MPEIIKTLKLDRLDFYKTHLSIVNCIIPVKLTPTEVEVLAAFMALEGDIAEYRFSSGGRKIVKDRLGLSSSSLSGHLGNMLLKEFIKKDELERIHIWPLLIPEDSQQIYRLRILNQNHVSNQSVQTNSASVS